MPGVKAVMTGHDLVEYPWDKPAPLGIQDLRFNSRNVMARDKALYAGHAVAAVAATSTQIAAAALKLIEVDYEVLPWVIDVDEALLPGAPILHEHMANVGAKPGPATTSNIAGKLEHTLGDVEAGFAAADVVVERSFKTKPVHQGYIEPHACVVSVAQDGRTTIWSSSQGHFMVRDMTAQLTGMKLSDVRAIPAEIGGGFGGKTIVYLEPVALVLSRKAGRPVKIVMNRQEVFRATGPTSGSSSTVKIGATKDGKITAVSATYRLQAGAFPGSPIRGAVGCALAPYDVANALPRRLRRRDEPAEGRSLSRAGRADRRLRDGEHSRRAGPGLEDGPARSAPEECGQARNQDSLWADVPAHRLRGNPAGCPRASALSDTPGPRTRAEALPAASGATPVASPAPRSTSTRMARWWW